ncbi:FecR domain-containing protein [Planctomicrobium sp. SH664]|uniref:FecR domain-containing protein n=1 Tax=Planctomicrobium sp. SH664 TaxID=3448125 RepID=UPI003F5B664F
MPERDSPALDEPLPQLVNAILDDRATPSDWRQLSEIIVRSTEACDYFTTQVALHAKLRQVSTRYSEAHLTEALPSRKSGGDRASETPAGGSHRRRRWSQAAAVVACLLFAAVVTGNLTLTGVSPGSRLVTSAPQIGEMHLVNHEGDATEAQVVRRIHLGERVVVENRQAEIRFLNGIRMRLAGLSEVTLEDGMNCVLHRGKAFVTVPEGVSGFRIRAAETQITDYGTEFGVSIGDNNTAEVAVVKGVVGVRPDKGGTETQLKTGQGVLIESGVLKRLYLVTDASFPTKQQLPSRQPLIVDVRDNIRSVDSLNYYRVAERAFGEDAKIYVDRPHEFNGMTEAGLPAYLLGADYLMTFNGDKQLDLRLSITLSRPADLYLIFDDRTAPPSWLKNEFILMPEGVGIDEQTVSTGPERLGVGPGVSVDRQLSLWKRSIPQPGTVELGSVNAYSDSSLMYAIVVVPHDQQSSAQQSPAGEHRVSAHTDVTPPQELTNP